jgi:hypothetical protein
MTSEPAPSSPPASPPHDATSVTWRAVALSVYVIAFGTGLAYMGVPKDPYRLFAWLWFATIAYNIRAPWRTHLLFVRDWWPAFALLVVYLYSRGVADELIPISVEWTMPIRFDTWLTGGTLPTQYLQEAWCPDPCSLAQPPRWYDVVLTTVYYTHFVAGLGIAVVLWLRDRALWVPWMTRYVAINFAALVVYIAYPMAPPWMAADEGYIDADLVRLTSRGWADVGLGSFQLVLAKVGNPVAAMPSLHAGLAALIAFYAIARLKSGWRWVAMAYPILMGITLVYYAEHYVIDVAAGWILAAIVMIACTLHERRRMESETPVRTAQIDTHDT